MLSRFRQSFLVRGVAYVLGVIWCIGALAGAVAPWCLNVSIPWQNGYSRIDIRSSRGVCGISLQHVDAVASAQIQKVQGPRTRVFSPLVSIQRIAALGSWQLPTPVLLSRWIGGGTYGDFAKEARIPGRMPYAGIVIGILPQLAIAGTTVWRSICWRRRSAEEDRAFGE